MEIMFKLAVALLMCLVSNVAFAASAPKALIVVMGGDDRNTRREISDAIARDMRVAPPDEFIAALDNEGLGVPLGEALANPRTRKPTIATARRALEAIGAPAVLSVHARREGSVREVHVVAIISTQAGPLIEEDFHIPPNERATPQLLALLTASLPELARSPQAAAEVSPPPKRADGKRVVEKKAPLEEDARAEASPPAKSKRAAAKKPPAEEEDLPEEAPSSPSERDRAASGSASTRRADPSNATWIVHGGVELARRDLQYSDPWAGRLRSHLAPALAVYGVGAELYPGAQTGTPFMKDFGFVGRFADSLPFETAASNGQVAHGGFRRYAAGVRQRFRAGDQKSSPLIGIEATYGIWQVAFSGPDEVVDEAPSVTYRHIRAGLDGRFPFGPFSVVGSAGYMFVSSAGKYTERFPNAQIGAVDAAVGGTWSVAPTVELRLTVAYARFFSSAHPEPGAAYVAGGALDQYLMTNLGASVFF